MTQRATALALFSQGLNRHEIADEMGMRLIRHDRAKATA